MKVHSKRVEGAVTVKAKPAAKARPSPPLPRRARKKAAAVASKAATVKASHAAKAAARGQACSRNQSQTGPHRPPVRPARPKAPVTPHETHGRRRCSPAASSASVSTAAPAAPAGVPAPAARAARVAFVAVDRSVHAPSGRLHGCQIQLCTDQVQQHHLRAAATGGRQERPQARQQLEDQDAEQMTDAEVIAMPDSEYMNEKQMAFFRLKLIGLKQGILENAGETTEHLREDTVVVPDPADRATIEEEHALELRTRDRERKLLKKIEQSIVRIDAGDYGYCDETGEPIGVGRLLAGPTATSRSRRSSGASSNRRCSATSRHKALVATHAPRKNTEAPFFEGREVRRNPLKDWAELDAADTAAPETGYSREMLKEMIERRQRNDFVRRREFDMLRKMRRREAAGERDAAAPVSVDSTSGQERRPCPHAQEDRRDRRADVAGSGGRPSMARHRAAAQSAVVLRCRRTFRSNSRWRPRRTTGPKRSRWNETWKRPSRWDWSPRPIRWRRSSFRSPPNLPRRSSLQPLCRQTGRSLPPLFPLFPLLPPFLPWHRLRPTRPQPLRSRSRDPHSRQ